MDQRSAGLEFTLHTSGADFVVRLRRLGERWVADVAGQEGRVGLGLTARAALSAALEPFGSNRRRELMADLALLSPSVEVARLERFGFG